MRRALLIAAIVADLLALGALAYPAPAATAQSGTVPPNIGQAWSATPTPTPPGPMYICAAGHCWVQWPTNLYLPLVQG